VEDVVGYGQQIDVEGAESKLFENECDVVSGGSLRNEAGQAEGVNRPEIIVL